MSEDAALESLEDVETSLVAAMGTAIPADIVHGRAA